MCSFFEKILECDWRVTYCPKCQSMCNECGKPISTLVTLESENVDSNNGTIMFSDCMNVGLVEVLYCDLPSSKYSKNLITVRCLECDQRQKYSGGGKNYHEFREISCLEKHFDFTKEEHIVKVLDIPMNNNVIKKCCRRCDDRDEDVNQKMIYNYSTLKTKNYTYCYTNYSYYSNDYLVADDFGEEFYE